MRPRGHAVQGRRLNISVWNHVTRCQHKNDVNTVSTQVMLNMRCNESTWINTFGADGKQIVS